MLSFSTKCSKRAMKHVQRPTLAVPARKIHLQRQNVTPSEGSTVADHPLEGPSTRQQQQQQPARRWPKYYKMLMLLLLSSLFTKHGADGAELPVGGTKGAGKEAGAGALRNKPSAHT